MKEKKKPQEVTPKPIKEDRIPIPGFMVSESIADDVDKTQFVDEFGYCHFVFGTKPNEEEEFFGMLLTYRREPFADGVKYITKCLCPQEKLACIMTKNLKLVQIEQEEKVLFTTKGLKVHAVEIHQQNDGILLLLL